MMWRPHKRTLIYVALIVVGVGVAAGIASLERLHHADAGDDQAGETAVAPPNRLRAMRSRSGDETAIVLDSGAVSRSRIATRVLDRMATDINRVQLAGVLVANPAQSTVIRAPVGGRLVSEREHWPVLGEFVAAGAELGQVSDARALTAPRAGTVTAVGAQPGEIVQAGQTLLEITDLSHPIARIVWSDGAPSRPPRKITVAPVQSSRGTAVEADARLVGSSSSVDSVTRAPVYLYELASAWAGALPGAPIAAFVPDASGVTRGVLVPNEAVVQWQGLPWIYVARGRSAFVRLPLDTSHPVATGWIVTSGLAPGDTLVVRGAQVLLSEEFRSRVAVGDEDQQ